jgi:hypothetical protein
MNNPVALTTERYDNIQMYVCKEKKMFEVSQASRAVNTRSFPA